MTLRHRLLMGAVIGALVGYGTAHGYLPRLDTLLAAAPAPKRPILYPRLDADAWPSRPPSNMWKDQ